MTDSEETKALEVAYHPGVEQLKKFGEAQGYKPEVVGYIAEYCQFYIDLGRQVKRQNLKYLELPPVLQVFKDDPAYLAALPFGRGFYRDAQLEIETDEQGNDVRVVLSFEQSEVFDIVDSTIRPPDRRVAVSQSLAYRVGFVVGFLSGLAVAQPDEATNGLAILAALVRPLLVAAPGSQDVALLDSPEKK